jgi:5'-phosphate synthase pdxT subunit
MSAPRVGILALQGDVEAHARALHDVGAQPFFVRCLEDLEQGTDALLLPGGESTTISKGLEREGLMDPLRDLVRSGVPILGTCAGAILLSREVKNHPVPTLGLLDAVAVRNAYGTQLDSFISNVDPDAQQEFTDFRAVFIRAPQLDCLGPEVEVLARVQGRPVLVRQGLVWAATFHPELTEDLRVHKIFLNKLCSQPR